MGKKWRETERKGQAGEEWKGAARNGVDGNGRTGKTSTGSVRSEMAGKVGQRNAWNVEIRTEAVW